MRSKLKVAASLGSVALLTGCYTVKALSFNIISPLGATALVFATYGTDRAHVEITNQTLNVRSAFFSDRYDAIIFDTFTGLNLIQNQGAKFRLARVVTIGNLFVVSTGSDADQTLDHADRIAGFGEGMMPDRIFKLTHSQLAVDQYYSSAAAAAAGLCTGQAEGKSLDYVVLSEPFIYNVLNNEDCATYGKASVVEDVRETFRNYSSSADVSLRGFPQAGLFISTRLESGGSNKARQNFLKTIDYDLMDLERAGASPTAELLMKYGTLEEQQARYGLDHQVLGALQLDGQTVINKLAYNSFPVDLDGFSAVYSATLGLVTPESSSYSRYYNFVKD